MSAATSIATGAATGIATCVARGAALGWCLCLLLGAACATPGDAGDPEPAADWQQLQSSAGSWVVGFRSEPSPIPLGAAFALEVSVARADGAALPADLSLRVDAGMPQHQHGMLRRPDLLRSGPGRFRAEGLLFHMPGAWTLVFDLTSGALTERAEVVVVLE